jgi:plasmid stability protein
MAQLVVRRIEDAVVRRLKARAAEHGRSAEEEHREILRAALSPKNAKRTFKAYLLEMPAVGNDEDFARRPDRRRRVKL